MKSKSPTFALIINLFLNFVALLFGVFVILSSALRIIIFGFASVSTYYPQVILGIVYGGLMTYIAVCSTKSARIAFKMMLNRRKGIEPTRDELFVEQMRSLIYASCSFFLFEIIFH